MRGGGAEKEREKGELARIRAEGGAIHREKTLSRARARGERRVVNLSRANNPRARPLFPTPYPGLTPSSYLFFSWVLIL